MSVYVALSQVVAVGEARGGGGRWDASAMETYRIYGTVRAACQHDFMAREAQMHKNALAP